MIIRGGEPNPNVGPVREFLGGTPAKYGNLGEIRAEMNELDAQIIELLAKRANCVNQAVLFKADPTEVIASLRQAEVIERATQLAIAQAPELPGFSELVSRLWAQMIPDFVSLQGEQFWQTQPIGAACPEQWFTDGLGWFLEAEIESPAVV